LLYSRLRRLIPSFPAIAATAVFALHPLQVEPVAWVFARSTLLCTLFCLLSLRAWINQRHWQATALFALALTAKEECVFFPIALALIMWGGLATRRGLAKPASCYVWQALSPATEPFSDGKKALAAMLALSALAGVRALFAT